MQERTSEARRLSHWLDHWTAISALSDAWETSPTEALADGLAEALMGALRAEFVYVHVPGDSSPVEVARAASGPLPAAFVQKIGEAVRHLRGHGAVSTTTLVNPVGDGTLRVATAEFGQGPSSGFVVAGAKRGSFPNESALLFLTSCAERAALGIGRRGQRTADKLATRILSELRAANRLILTAGLGAQQEADDAAADLAQLEALLGGLGEGVMVLEASGRALLMNAAAKLITNNTGGRGDGLQSLKIQWQGPAGSPLDSCDWPPVRALRGERFTDVELAGVVPGESAIRRATFSGSSVVDADGKVALAIITCRDVTELRRLEKLREEYFALISHDLRNPLSMVLLAGQRLAREALKDGDGERSEIIDLVMTSAQRMQGMLEELLEGGFVESGRIASDKEPISPVRLVTSLVHRIASSNADRQIELICPKEVEPILGDADRIERVVTNLLSNALKYSDSGSPIAVAIQTDGDRVTVSVRDAGRGISAKDLPHIFDRAYRAGNAASRAPGSFGLGLYIAHGIVEEHGGRIWAESELGVGTTVSFSLPIDTPNTSDGA